MVAKPLIRTCFVLIAVFGRNPIASAQVTVTIPIQPTATITSQELPKMTTPKALQDLMRIDDYRQTDLTQSTQNFELLYAQGNKAQKELSQWLQQMAWISQGTPMIPAQKSVERARTKIETELNGQVNQITDIARGTLVLKDIESLLTAYTWLAQRADILEVKNRFKAPAQSGYRDMKCLVRLPKTQHIAEVQLHLEGIANIKNGVEHQIYETIQHIERRANKDNRILSETEIQRITLLREHSQRLYKTAWRRYQSVQAA
jgi:hypothetical protein